MLKQSFCGSAEMIARLGGAFCGEKLVTGFALLDRRVEIDPATFNKTALDKIIQEDKFIEEVEVDYSELDYEKAKNLPGMIFSGDPTKTKVSMEKSEKMLMTHGFEEQK